MDLIACSYEHIGPFVGQKITVRFLAGSHLVKAPIGSGKSFLFFDGPIFGRYKWSTRPMLARTAESGEIQIVFSLKGDVRYIKRSLKQTKAGNDSVITHLYRVNTSPQHIEDILAPHGKTVIIHGLLIEDILVPYLEEIPANSQKEIDGLIQDLIPPREVTLSSSVLLQESDNIFEMTPAMRITVFKQLFDLLDMDQARQQLADQKKTIQIRRQVLQEDGDVTQKFHRHLSAMRETLQQLKNIALPNDLLQTLFQQWVQQPLLQDLFHVEDRVQLTGFSTHGYDETMRLHLLSQITIEKEQQLSLMGQSTQLRAQQQQLRKHSQELNQQIKQTETDLATITQALHAVDTEHLTKLQQEQSTLQDKLLDFFQQLPHQKATHHGIVFEALTDAQQRLTSILQEGKILQQQVDAIQQQVQNTQQEKEKLNRTKDQLTQQSLQLAKKIAEENNFNCDLIDGPCPYIELITKKASHSLHEHHQHMQEQIAQIDQGDIKKQEQQLADLHVQLTQKAESIDSLKALLQDLDWKRLQEIFTQTELLEKQLRNVDAQLRHYNLQRQQITDRQTQRIRLQEQLQALCQQEHTAQQNLSQTNASLKDFESKRTGQDCTLLQRIEEGLQTMGHQFYALQGMLTDWYQRQKEIDRLQHQEGLLKDLLTIFQKELLIVVLQNFLPVLEEVINIYLAQIVPFTLRFELPASLQDEIELNIWIHDEKGKRAVKSLSGGQKAVLRLCRIVAVSTVFKHPFLLLDETINSLDTEAIARVAEMLKDFVDKQQIKLYVVTHATQIQEMQLRESIITLDKYSS